MKRKFTKILGVMLPVAMILALAVSLLPVSSTPTVKANPGALRFETVTIPKIGLAGKYVLTPGTNVGTLAGSGTVLFAAADITTSGNVTDLLKSTDGGATWSLQAAFKTAATANGDTSTTIVAIKLSPDYATESTLFVATGRAVYQTVDGGTSFTAMTAAWAAGET
ncbi:MAG: hypothetical protein HYU85_04135, partial [Chloroflexi bacterium]|nr:hypothetical protein [Chloroflexota bacterium]